MTPLIESAEAVKTALAARAIEEEWTPKFIPERTWLPAWVLEDTYQNLIVAVAPVRDTPERISRTKQNHEIRVDIGLLKKLKKSPISNDEVDPLAELANTIAEYFRSGGDGGRPLIVGDYAVTEVLHEPVAAREHLEKYRQFTSVIQLTLVIVR